MSDERIRVAIIGGGMISQVAHLPFYLADRRCEVAGVAESRPSLAAALRERSGIARVTASHYELLADPTIAAVVIIAPRPAMGPLALNALTAGKHVLMEKPMAHTAAQAQRLVDAALTADRTLAIGFMKRCDPGVVAARQCLDALRRDNRLGRLLLARFYNFARHYAVPPPPHRRPRESRTERFAEWPLSPDWLTERDRESYAWFINSASHDINLIHYFFPAGVELQSASSRSSAAFLAGLAADDTLIELAVTKTSAGRWLEGAEFLFENGRLTLDIPSPMASDQVARVTLDEFGETSRDVAPIDGGWCFARQASGFVDVLTGAAAPPTDGAQGLRDLVLTEQIWRKIAEARHV